MVAFTDVEHCQKKRAKLRMLTAAGISRIVAPAAYIWLSLIPWRELAGANVLCLFRLGIQSYRVCVPQFPMAGCSIP